MMLALLNAAQQAASQIPLAPNPQGGQMPMQGMPAQAPQDPRQALLSQLNGIKLPEEIGLWPPAPGWWIVTGLALIAFGLAAWQLYKAHKKQRYRKHALSALEEIVNTTEQGSYAQCVAIMQLLKRSFFTAYPESRLKIAGIHSAQWFRLLEDSCKKSLTASAFEPAITALLYKNNVGPQAQALSQLYEFTRQWIKHHYQASDQQTENIAKAAIQIDAQIKHINDSQGVARV